jgi:hypothetical protein
VTVSGACCSQFHTAISKPYGYMSSEESLGINATISVLAAAVKGCRCSELRRRD